MPQFGEQTVPLGGAGGRASERVARQLARRMRMTRFRPPKPTFAGHKTLPVKCWGALRAPFSRRHLHRHSYVDCKILRVVADKREVSGEMQDHTGDRICAAVCYDPACLFARSRLRSQQVLLKQLREAVPIWLASHRTRLTRSSCTAACFAFIRVATARALISVG